MVLVSHDHRFIYTKTVKTASTSVELFLEPLVTGEVGAQERTETIENRRGVVGYRGGDPAGQEWFNHMSLESVASKVGAEDFRSYFKFCCVRDPFDKLLSAFFFFSPLMKQAGRAEQIATFRTWLDRDALEADWRTASVFDRDKYVLADGEVGVDFFVRYERLSVDLKVVLDRLGVVDYQTELPRLKSSTRPQISTGEFYGEPERAKVNDWYDFEFELFGYDRRPC